MALFESLAAILSTKAGVTAAGLAVAAGSVGAAGAAGTLPDDVQTAFDRAISGEQVGEETAAEAEATAEEAQLNGDDHERASQVREVLTGDVDLEPGDEGFGEAVVENAQEGGAEFGADVASSASDGRSDAGADAAAEGEANADDQAADGEARADAGADNADVADDYRQDAGQPDDLPEQSDTGTSTASERAGR